LTELVLLGPLAPDGATRIHRRLDDQVQSTVRRDRSMNVTGGRQSGKTTSLLELRQWVVTDGGASAYVDMSPLGDIDQPANQWLAEFAAATNRSLLPEELRTSAPPGPDDFAGLQEYFLELAKIASPRRPFVLILDEVTGVPARFQHPFFYSIRAMINLKSDAGRPHGADDILFVFGGSFDPERLIRDSNNSPFNVSETIDTASYDFDIEEVRATLTLSGSALTPEVVLDLTDGHPYLTNLVATMPSDPPLADIAQVVIGRIDMHIAYISRNLTANPELLKLACQIVAGETIPFVPAMDERLSALWVIGLIKPTESGDCSLRGDIYRRLASYLCTVDPDRNDVGWAPGPLDFVPDALRLNLVPLFAAAAAYASDSPAAATVCMGAVLEGALLTLLELHAPGDLRTIADAVNAEVGAGRLNASARINPATKSAADWTLEQMIEGARIAGLVSSTASHVSHAMRDWRNLIHPAKARDLYPTGVPGDIGQASVANGAVLLREIADAAGRV